MNNNPDKESKKNSDVKPEKEKKGVYKLKLISIDDKYITVEYEGKEYRRNLDSDVLRTREYRQWLVDCGYWIPSMDLTEAIFTFSDEYTVEEDDEVGGVANEQTESLEVRMKKLKAQQQGNFKKYYERKASQEKEKKSKNSKSKDKKSEMEVKKGMDPPKTQDPEKPEKPSTGEVGEEKVKGKNPPESEDPPPLKETVRSHYCYTEMHLVNQGQIHRWNIDSKSFRNPEYRKWLVDCGYWIPSMDLRELFFTIDPEEYTVEEDEEAGGVACEQAESLEERMKKLKAQQQGNFKKYYERKEAREKMKKSKNSKSKFKKSEVEMKKDDIVKKGMDLQKVETLKNEKPKPQEGGVEKIKKVDPPKTRTPEKAGKTPTGEVRAEKVKTQNPPKIEDPIAQTSKKTEDPSLKETVRSHYCYTEMHLVSGKEIKKKK
ncbi:unnamed protein product [Caenorhabditis brenneri]